MKPFIILDRDGTINEECGYLSTLPFRKMSCRNPETLLFEQAVRELDIDMKHSFLVGDRISDIQPAGKLGANYALLKTGYGSTEDVSGFDSCFIFIDLSAFADYLDKNLKEKKYEKTEYLSAEILFIKDI